jgi:hypothetical protein
MKDIYKLTINHETKNSYHAFFSSLNNYNRFISITKLSKSENFHIYVSVQLEMDFNIARDIYKSFKSKKEAMNEARNIINSFGSKIVDAELEIYL